MRSAACGVWKIWSVENEDCGKCGVWKMRSVEKCGVWKIFHFNFPFPCGKTVWKNIWNVNKLEKNAMHHCIFKMRRVRLVIGVGIICAVY